MRQLGGIAVVGQSTKVLAASEAVRRHGSQVVGQSTKCLAASTLGVCNKRDIFEQGSVRQQRSEQDLAVSEADRR